MDEDEKFEAEENRLANVRAADVIYAPTEEDMQNPFVLQLLGVIMWLITWQGRRNSRRYFRDIAADVLRDMRSELRTADGKPFPPIGDIDDEFDENDELVRALFAAPLRSERWVPQRKQVRALQVISTLVLAGGPVLWRDLKHCHQRR